MLSKDNFFEKILRHPKRKYFDFVNLIFGIYPYAVISFEDFFSSSSIFYRDSYTINKKEIVKNNLRDITFTAKPLNDL